MVTISRAHAAAASAAMLLSLGCGSRGSRMGIHADAPAGTVTAEKVLPPLPLAQVFVLEAAGGQPDDTVVTLPERMGRVIVLRRSAPDFGLFARLDFRATGDTGRSGPSARVTVKPLPGRYGVDLAIEGQGTDSATITFSYGTHFVAPAGARERYGSNLAFEKELAIGRVGDDSIVVFLPTLRPGADLVTAPLRGAGRYIVAAPR